MEALPSGPPRAAILALHGYTANYLDDPLDDSASLLRIGADLGYRVIARDRPEYGARVYHLRAIAFLDEILATQGV
ncbi:MAG: hypothetical protein AB7L13_12050 [Acidimicrobiia bacterium]